MGMGGADRPASGTLEGIEVFFTVTTGRSGTGYLSTIARILHDVDARHEPRPSFVEVMRTVQDGRYPDLARRWLEEEKIPAIARCNKPAYLESSHLFCKGFLEPWLDLAPPPNLVIWHREPRSIAKSLFRIDSVPGRSPAGIRWFLGPGDPGVLPVRDPETLDDYQVCYWYVLEIERRQAAYAAQVEAAGGRVLRSDIGTLSTAGGFAALTRFLRHREPDAIEQMQFDRQASRPVNTKAHVKAAVSRQLPDDLDALEADVHERIG
ncbi:MAG: hypothetical protein H6737_10870 [Alphaproteobacteria bacterium]|nr:hypothetical protein [Alphaproteobacteria bacterium]